MKADTVQSKPLPRTLAAKPHCRWPRLRREVHPEPGSNSPKKESVLAKKSLTYLLKQFKNELTLIVRPG
jgi:hypothetical protein